ncbi:MAG: S1C family serine protease [Magnetovibrionaceae bacterium]
MRKTLLSAVLFAGGLGLTGSLPAFAADIRLDRSILQSVVSVLPVLDDEEQANRQGNPEGSGTVVFEGGYIATNFHVLGRAETARVRTHDGRVLDARIIGRDGATDIALLKVEADLPVPAFRLEAPALTETVCAVGNAFGFDLSVTCGVVSAVHRTGTGFNPMEDFIQTDAAANPGNSGGGLFDREGRLVGMVSAIFADASDMNVGVNFATSTRLLLRITGDQKDDGRVSRGVSGLRVGPLSRAQRVKTNGVAVKRILDRGGAQASGLREGDIITQIEDRLIRQGSDVTSVFSLHRPGDVLTIRYLRGGEAATARLQLGAPRG